MTATGTVPPRPQRPPAPDRALGKGSAARARRLVRGDPPQEKRRRPYTTSFEERSEWAKRSWETRRKKGGLHNTPVIGPDGRIADFAYDADPVTGCHVWALSVSGAGTPQAFGARSVRQHVWAMAGKPGAPARITTSCGNARCINPDHLVPGHRNQLQRRQKDEALLSGAHPGDVAARFGTREKRERTRAGKLGVRYDRPPSRNVANANAGIDRPLGVSDRDWAVFCALKTGTTRSVAAEFDLSPQRVYQIAQHVILVARDPTVRWKGKKRDAAVVVAFLEGEQS